MMCIVIVAAYLSMTVFVGAAFARWGATVDVDWEVAFHGFIIGMLWPVVLPIFVIVGAIYALAGGEIQ